MTRICLVLGEKTFQQTLDSASRHEQWCDLYEIRADYWNPRELSSLKSLPAQLNKPAILTIRLPIDGGQWEGPLEERECILLEALDGSWFGVDIEMDQNLPLVESKARERGIKVIESFHDFHGIPQDIPRLFLEIAQKGHIPKGATWIESTQDFVEWTKVAEQIAALGEKVFLGMGDFGTPTRILGGRWNISWTYASCSDQPLAPGQVPVKELKDLYQVEKISYSTQVFGIIGNPVLHSKSPLIHNRALGFLGLNAVYVPFPVDKPLHFWPLLESLGIQGLSVTIPWKEAALEMAKNALSDQAKKIGACNTLSFSSPRWKGDNTDAPGFLEPLLDHFTQEQWAGLKVLVIGNGGAARAAIYALKEAGCEVLVLGRNLSKVQGLAFEMGVKSALLHPSSLEQIKAHRHLMIQTTPVGMGAHEGENPLEFYDFQGDEVIYDMIYVPLWTPFLKKGKEKGCKIFFGKDMLLGQAYHQFKIFTGQDYPQELKEIVARELEKLSH